MHAGKLLSWPETEQTLGRPISLVHTFAIPPLLLLIVAAIFAPFLGIAFAPMNLVLAVPDTTEIPSAVFSETNFMLLGFFSSPLQVAGTAQGPISFASTDKLYQVDVASPPKSI